MKLTSMIEIGAKYSHKENGLTVVVKDIEYNPRGTIIWFVFDENDWSATRYARSENEFRDKFEITLNGDMKESLDRLIAVYGADKVLNYVGKKYKESLV